MKTLIYKRWTTRNDSLFLTVESIGNRTRFESIEAYKIASTDNDNYPFLKYLSKKNRPIIISTAMSNMKDVLYAEKTLIQNKCKQYAFLQCTGNYPSKIEDANLKQKLNFTKFI